MKIILNVLGGVCIALGAFWASQGMNIIKTGVMAGHRRWIVIGEILFIGGFFFIIFANRPKPGKPATKD